MKIGIEDVIQAYGTEDEVSPNIAAYASELYQEAIKIGMEMNSVYHTPEELREIMSRLIGKEVDESFRVFPPFYTDF